MLFMDTSFLILADPPVVISGTSACWDLGSLATLLCSSNFLTVLWVTGFSMVSFEFVFFYAPQLFLYALRHRKFGA